jgi:hypothetical protein
VLPSAIRFRARIFHSARQSEWWFFPYHRGGRRDRNAALPPNTNILETKFETSTGSFRVIDFAPRFMQYGRAFRTTQLIRMIEPIEGPPPGITVLCEPRLGWSKERPAMTQGSHHIQFDGFASPFRLTTDLPLSYLGGKPFSLTGRQHLILSWGAPVEEPLAPLCERFWSETSQYWHRWVKQCDIPPLFQQEVIRSALTLKLHCFEDTGAIIAAMTTFIPESEGTDRNWDYRYCWLRDSYYVLSAFGLLGQFEEREQFVQYLLNVAGGAAGLNLAPLYRMADISSVHAPALSAEFQAAADHIREEVVSKSWNTTSRSFVGHYGGEELDASLLQMVKLRFLKAGDPKLTSTVDAIHKHLARGSWLDRYSLNDGFGNPSVAFVICTFWLIEALSASGRAPEARAVFDGIYSALSPLGLLSEDFDPTAPRMWGNFPQTYSHVGLIHAAFACSPTWPQVL